MIVAGCGTLSIVVTEKDVAPLPNLRTEIPFGTILTHPPRLSERLIELLPRRAYVVSRRSVDGQAILAEKLGKIRDVAWRRAVNSGVAGRTCYLAWS